MPEKICEHCHQPIKANEGYAETDFGTGKWVHWPSCPSSSPKKLTEQERPSPPSWESVSEAVVKEAEIPTFTPALLGLIKTAWETKTNQRFWEWFITPISNGVTVTLSGTAKPHEFFPKEIIEKMHYDETQRIFITKSGSEHHSSENPEHSNPGIGEIHIVDGLTLKDYYDLRDLRLLLMGLEKELIGKYGIIEAENLSAKVRELIKKKIEQITNKINSTPEHHSSGNPDGQLERCVICGYEGTKEKDQHGNYIFYWGNEPICMACREDHSMELDAGIKPSSLKGKSEARHSNPGEHHVTREEAEAEISVLIDNLTAAIKKGGEIPPELRQALVKNFLFFKSNPGFPSTYTDFENWLKKDMNMTVEQFKALEQPRKDVIYSLFRGAWENNSLPPSWKQTESQHPSVSTGNPDGKKRRYKPTTYTIPKYAITKDNVAFSFKEKIRKQYNPDIDGEEEETTIEVSADYNNKNYGFNVRNLFDFGLAVNPKGETSTANGLSGGLPMNVEEFMKSNRYLAWSPERELTREEQEQVFRKEHPTETGYGWDRGSLEGQKWVSMTKDEVHVYEALLKTLPEYMHEVRMGGNPDGKFKVRFNEGTEKQEDMTLPASSPEAATIEASRKYFESYKEYPKTARIVSHHLSAGNPDEKMLRMPSPETEQRKAARLSKERHSGGI